MAHIVCVTGGLTGIFNASLALVEQLMQAGHQVTYASPADFSEALAASNISFVQLEPWVIQSGDPPMNRWQKLRQLRSRQQKAVEGLGVGNFVQKMRSLSPDLLLIDMEMHPHIMAAVKAGLTVGLLCQFLSVWHRPSLPPIDTQIVPGKGWRGSRWGIELSWLHHGWRKWQEAQRERWRRVGCDRISVLRCYARQIGYGVGYGYRPLRWRGAGWRQWLVPYPHADISVLCMNANELDFPHAPHPTMHYIGPMVQPQRPQLQVSEQTQRQVMDFLAHRASNRSLIYCSCSTFVKGNAHFLQEVIAAIAAQPQWELVLGLGGQLSPQALGELPAHVYAFDWVPQMLLLQHADCAIHNGGINSLNECLYYGVPMLIYSLKRYDQEGNAARATYHRLGIAGDIEQDDARQIGTHLQQLLSDPRYRQRAKAMSDRTRYYAADNVAASVVASLIGTRDMEMPDGQISCTGPHPKSVSPQISMQPASAQDSEALSYYIVCSTVRSGSTLLCRTLSRLPGFGQPEEYFHRHIIRDRQLESGPEAFSHYVKEIVADQANYKQVGLKMHWWQLKDFVRLARQRPECAGMTMAETLGHFFPGAKLIYLQRQDMVAQAVSAAIATQTNQWESTTERTEVAFTKPIKFQPWRIYQWEQALLEQNRDWEQFFAANALSYLPLVYEDMVADFEGTMAQVTNYIQGQSVDSQQEHDSPPEVHMPTKRQSNRVNQQFIRTYRRFPRPVWAGLYRLYARLRPQQAGGQ